MSRYIYSNDLYEVVNEAVSDLAVDAFEEIDEANSRKRRRRRKGSSKRPRPRVMRINVNAQGLILGSGGELSWPQIVEVYNMDSRLIERVPYTDEVNRRILSGRWR